MAYHKLRVFKAHHLVSCDTDNLRSHHCMDIPPKVYWSFKSCFCHQGLFLHGFLHYKLIVVGIF